MKPLDYRDFEKHKAEAKEKWKKTDAYKEYEKKTGNYPNQKWDALAQGMNLIMAEFAACMKTGFCSGADPCEAAAGSYYRKLLSLYQCNSGRAWADVCCR